MGLNQLRCRTPFRTIQCPSLVRGARHFPQTQGSQVELRQALPLCSPQCRTLCPTIRQPVFRLEAIGQHRQSQGPELPSNLRSHYLTLLETLQRSLARHQANPARAMSIVPVRWGLLTQFSLHPLTVLDHFQLGWHPRRDYLPSRFRIALRFLGHQELQCSPVAPLGLAPVTPPLFLKPLLAAALIQHPIPLIGLAQQAAA